MARFGNLRTPLTRAEADYFVDELLPYAARLARGCGYFIAAFVLAKLNGYGVSQWTVPLVIGFLGLGGRASIVSLGGIAALLAMVIFDPATVQAIRQSF